MTEQPIIIPFSEGDRICWLENGSNIIKSGMIVADDEGVLYIGTRPPTEICDAANKISSTSSMKIKGVRSTYKRNRKSLDLKKGLKRLLFCRHNKQASGSGGKNRQTNGLARIHINIALYIA